MLRTDLQGVLIPPGVTVKRFGGPFDTRGIPDDFTIPTTGDYSGVSVANNNLVSKNISRTTTGKARIQGPAILIDGDMQGLKIEASFVGGGSGQTTGATRRHLRMGFLSDDNDDGGLLEFLSADSADAGTWFSARKDGVSTRKAVNFSINEAVGRYNIGVWMSRNATDGWSVSIEEGGQITKVASFTSEEIGAVTATTTLRPVLEWEWTYASGSFLVRVQQAFGEIWWL